MAVREIKTTLSLDGEKEFNKAINEAGRGMRVMASEMKAAAADFDVTGDEMEYLGRKSRSLNSQIEQQEKIIRALEGAVADSAQTYGEASAKTDGYRIKLNNAYASLSRLKKEHEQTDKRMEELGRDSERTGRKLEQGIGEAADDVSRKFDSMVNKLDSDIGSIKSMTSISAVVDVAGTIGGALKGAYDAVTGLVDETAEYNRSMSFLKTNADQAGVSFQTVKKMAIDVSGITGDMDATIEGLSNLLASGFEADELAIAVERLSGAIIQIPDTLKFESLADGLQETIATRNAVGQYAEYLERMGLDLDTVNKALAKAGKEGQEAVESVALSFLSGHGAEEALAKYRAENEELVKYFEAQAKLTDAQARLGETMTPVATAGIEMAAGFVDKMTDMMIEVGKVVETWQAAAEKGLLETSKDVEEARENLSTEPWAPGITTDGSEANEAGKTDAGEYHDGVKEYFENNPIEVPGWDEINPGIETGDVEIVKNLEKKIDDTLDAASNYAESNGKDIMSVIESLMNAPGILTIGSEAAETYIESVDEYFENNPVEVPGWDEINPGIETGAAETGKNLVRSLGDAVEDNAYYAVSKVNSMMSSIQAALNRKITYPTIRPSTTTSSAAYASAGTGKTTLSIDGKKLGEATVAYNNAALGQSLIRAETYG